tara:strand:+ start:988 stop:1437 length:450 start_codon:yes stop_codon:yes gene_type:complete
MSETPYTKEQWNDAKKVSMTGGITDLCCFTISSDPKYNIPKAWQGKLIICHCLTDMVNCCIHLWSGTCFNLCVCDSCHKCCDCTDANGFDYEIPKKNKENVVAKNNDKEDTGASKEEDSPDEEMGFVSGRRKKYSEYYKNNYSNRNTRF